MVLDRQDRLICVVKSDHLPYLISNRKINPKWIADAHVQPKSTQQKAQEKAFATLAQEKASEDTQKRGHRTQK